MEVVSRVLSTLLRAIIRKNWKTWEDCLPHIEFAYNHSVHSATNHSLFEVVYGFNLLTPLDLLPLPSNQLVHVDGKKKAEFVKQLHQRVRENIERRIKQYAYKMNKGRKRVIFKLSDWVMIWGQIALKRGNDAILAREATVDPVQLPLGPITRSYSKKLFRAT
ncbi:uncharacterized protein LOC108464811 [Gossypium arboreum]|uniref:uncharacterized protein LOC108464811 n=1 Tax=Gossypium arboreum TaxID=29729 RepID=UPI000818FAE9|nr:uncharacterized protein LOC108464811 [Gossypium arboreum]